MAQKLLRRGLALEYITLAWNAVGVIVLAISTVAARWWWADPLSALVILVYGLREARQAWVAAG